MRNRFTLTINIILSSLSLYCPLLDVLVICTTAISIKHEDCFLSPDTEAQGGQGASGRGKGKTPKTESEIGLLDYLFVHPFLVLDGLFRHARVSSTYPCMSVGKSYF